MYWINGFNHGRIFIVESSISTYHNYGIGKSKNEHQEPEQPTIYMNFLATWNMFNVDAQVMKLSYLTTYVKP